MCVCGCVPTITWQIKGSFEGCSGISSTRSVNPSPHHSLIFTKDRRIGMRPWCACTCVFTAVSEHICLCLCVHPGRFGLQAWVTGWWLQGCVCQCSWESRGKTGLRKKTVCVKEWVYKQRSVCKKSRKIWERMRGFLSWQLEARKACFMVVIIHHPICVCAHLCVSQDESSLFAGLSACLALKAAGINELIHSLPLWHNLAFLYSFSHTFSHSLFHWHPPLSWCCYRSMWHVFHTPINSLGPLLLTPGACC